MTFPFAHLFFEDFFFEDFFFGTLPPSFRASDNPIAIACFLLVTFLPDLPLFSVPSLRSCIAFLTFFCAKRERSEEHTSELQSLAYLVCRLLLEKKNNLESAYRIR